MTASGIGLKLGSAASCVLCGFILSPALTFSQAATTFAGRCFSYDGAGRMTGVRDQSGATRSYGLDPASNRKAITAATGAVCSGTGVPTPATLAPPPPPPPPGPPPPPPPPPSTNRPPVANTDFLQVAQWETASILVLANDSDPDGDQLEVSGATFSSARVNVTRVQQVTNGPYTYLDVVGLSTGTTQINYTITDNKGGTAVGIVNVTVTQPDLR